MSAAVHDELSLTSFSFDCPNFEYCRGANTSAVMFQSHYSTEATLS